MTKEDFKEFQKFITENDFSDDDIFRLVIQYHYYTNWESEETKIYDDWKSFQENCVKDNIKDEHIEHINSIRIIFGEWFDECEFRSSEPLEILKERE